MPRPKKRPTERRLVRLPSPRVTQEDFDQISARAKKADMTLSEFQRVSCLSSEIVVSQAQTTDVALVNQLRAIGVNLNQLTRKFNMTDEEPPELRSLLSHLQNYLDQIFSTHDYAD